MLKNILEKAIKIKWVRVGNIGLLIMLNFLVFNLKKDNGPVYLIIYSTQTTYLSEQDQKSLSKDTKFSKDLQKGEVLASKNGTKYYFPGCSGVSRIKPENIVYFGSEKDALAKGLVLAKNCVK